MCSNYWNARSDKSKCRYTIYYFVLIFVSKVFLVFLNVQEIFIERFKVQIPLFFRSYFRLAHMIFTGYTCITKYCTCGKVKFKIAATNLSR